MLGGAGAESPHRRWPTINVCAAPAPATLPGTADASVGDRAQADARPVVERVERRSGGDGDV